MYGIILIGGSMKKVKVSLVLNILIVAMVIFSVLSMMLGLEFMGHSVVFTTRHISIFKFFTIDSNILVGITTLIMAIYEIIYLKSKKEIPKFVYILKFMGTASVTLTFLVTALFLAPFSVFNYFDFYMNSNLFLHLITPIVSVISYIFFEKCELSFKSSFLGIVPMALYAIYYVGMIVPHIENGTVSYDYDFYGFLRGGVSTVFWVVPLMFIVMYLISLVLWYSNKKIK